MRLCFLDTQAFDGGETRGAALVTDERTRPIEFRVTDAVCCGELQRLLYGASFDDHVVLDAIGRPLLDALRERPDYVLVREQVGLELQASVDRPVFWIGRDDDGIVMGYHGADDEIQRARSELRAIAERYDLLEPFERSRAALRHVHEHQNGSIE